MDGRMDGRMEGRKDGWKEGWKKERKDGRKEGWCYSLGDPKLDIPVWKTGSGCAFVD